jgi:hypothetical protein
MELELNRKLFSHHSPFILHDWLVGAASLWSSKHVPKLKQNLKNWSSNSNPSIGSVRVHFFIFSPSNFSIGNVRVHSFIFFSQEHKM